MSQVHISMAARAHTGGVWWSALGLSAVRLWSQPLCVEVEVRFIGLREERYAGG